MMKKIISLFFSILFSSLSMLGCGEFPTTTLPTDTPIMDAYYMKSDKNRTFGVVKIHNTFYAFLDGFRVTEFSKNPKLDLENGEFANIVADITYTAGGEAYMERNPKIDQLISCEKLSFDDAIKQYNIQELDSKFIFYQPLVWNYNQNQYLVFIERHKDYLKHYDDTYSNDYTIYVYDKHEIVLFIDRYNSKEHEDLKSFLIDTIEN